MNTIAKDRFMSDQLKKITENTLIPISLVIVLIGGVVWVTNIWATVNSNTKAISTIQEDNKDIDEKFDKIMIELYYLKGAVNANKKKGD